MRTCTKENSLSEITKTKHRKWTMLAMCNSFKCASGIYSGYKTHQQSLATALKYVGGCPELLPPVAKPVCAPTEGVGWGRGGEGWLQRQQPQGEEGSVQSRGIKNGAMVEESGRDLYFRHGKRRASSSGWRQSSATRPLPLPPSRAGLKRSSHLQLITRPPPQTDKEYSIYTNKIDQSKLCHRN